MYGPYPRRDASLKALNCSPAFKFLRAGGRYRVIADFRDFDGDLHPVGERWEFLYESFLPYDDGQSLFVSLDGEHEWQIRLQGSADEQAHIIERLDEYIAPDTPGPPHGTPSH